MTVNKKGNTQIQWFSELNGPIGFRFGGYRFYEHIFFCEKRPVVKIFLQLGALPLRKKLSSFGDRSNVKWNHSNIVN